MDVIDIVVLFLLNAIPIVLLVIPYLFIRKKFAGKIYFRIMLGIMVFYLVYWVLPIIFQFGTAPKELKVDEVNLGLGIGYIFTHFGSLISLFAYYPLVTLPFIFFIAPFISIIYVRNRVRKEVGTKSEKMKGLTYKIIESPFKRIRSDLFKSDWSREKDIMKLLIVLLPVSLYLLQVIIKVSGPENITIQSSLGWFIEILFVYLATFIFSLEILFSSQIALRGRYFGENIRQQTYKSLYTVGAPISILSIILFIVEDIESFGIIIYFFAYFLMASIIFILFLKIFEPISLLIFIKIIDWMKNRKEKRKKMNTVNFYYGIVFSFLAFTIFIILNNFVFGGAYPFIFGDLTRQKSIIDSANFAASDPVYLYESFEFDQMILFNFVALVVVSLIIAVYFLNLTLKYTKSMFLSIVTYLPILIVLSILFVALEGNGLINFKPDTYWITGQTSFTSIFGFNFFTLRTAGFDAELTGVLNILAKPYQYTQYIFNIVFWSLIIFYMKKNFRVKNLAIDEKHLEKVIFSSITEFPTYDEYAKTDTRYLITRSSDIDLRNIALEREEVKSLLEMLETDQMLDKIIPEEEKEMQRFYFTLKYLYNKNQIDVLKQEFSYIYEKAEKQGLYIIYDDGRGIFDYNFSKEYDHDPGIVSGMFSAITSFIKETTKSQELLKTIDHGDITILIEYGNRIFGALFIKGKQTAEVRSSLKELVTTFEAKYAEVLADWSGALIYFKEDNKLVENIFKD